MVLLMFFNISYLYSFDAINLQKLPFFHNRAAELELLYYSVILTFSRKNGTPAGAARFHPFFPPLRPAEESILWKQFLCCIEEVEIWKFTKWGVTFLRRIGST